MKNRYFLCIYLFISFINLPSSLGMQRLSRWAETCRAVKNQKTPCQLWITAYRSKRSAKLTALFLCVFIFVCILELAIIALPRDYLVSPNFDGASPPLDSKFLGVISAKSPKIDVVSFNIGAGPWCKCVEENHVQYAEQNGYRYTIYKEEHPNRTLPPVFEKMLHMKEHMQRAAKRNVSLILMVDCDLVFTDMSTKIEDVWHAWASSSTELIVARDFHYLLPGRPRVNFGATIYKPSNWNLRLLQAIIEKGEVPGKSFAEQSRLIEELIKLGQLYRYYPLASEIHSKVSVIPQSVMNAFFYGQSFYHLLYTNTALWRPGYWMAHMAGRKKAFRMKAVKEVFHLCSELPETAELEWNQAQSIIRALQNKSSAHLLVLGVGDSAFFLHAHIPYVSFLINPERYSDLSSRMPRLNFQLMPLQNFSNEQKNKWDAVYVNIPQIDKEGSEKAYLDLAMHCISPSGDLFVNECQNKNIHDYIVSSDTFHIRGYEPRSDGSRLCNYQK